jgi:hypothetical protein
MRHALHLIKTSIIKDAVGTTNIFELITYARLVTVIISIGLMFTYEYLLFKDISENKKLKLMANTVIIIMFILLGQATESQFIYFKF